MVSQIAPVSLNRLAFLKKTNFFKGIEHEAFLEDLAAEMEEQTFAENEVVLHRGDRDQLIFFMIAGKSRFMSGTSRWPNCPEVPISVTLPCLITNPLLLQLQLFKLANAWFYISPSYSPH